MALQHDPAASTQAASNPQNAAPANPDAPAQPPVNRRRALRVLGQGAVQPSVASVRLEESFHCDS
jgi:hypothetical protein